MSIRAGVAVTIVASFALATLGCEPANITAARNQLARGGDRTVALAVPITGDTLVIGKFLSSSDTTTTAGGLLGMRLQPETLSSAVGQQLQFNNLTFQQFKFSYNQMLTAAPDSASLSATFPSAPARSLAAAPPVGPAKAPPIITLDTIRLATPQGSKVSSATIGAGRVIAQITNHTSCTAAITENVTDGTNATVLSFSAASVAPNATVTDTVDAAGKSFSGFLALATPTITPAGLCLFASGDAVAIKLGTTTLTLSSVALTNVNEAFTQTYNVLASEPRIQAVDTVVAHSGSFSVTVQNRLPLTASFTLTLNGVTKGGVPLSASLTVPAAPGDGTTKSGTLVLDLTGATIRPAAVVAKWSGR